jgi:uncharacterized protein
MKLLVLLSVLFVSPLFSQENFWDKLPKPIGYVNDFENILTQKEEKELNKLITDYEKKTTVEIAIVTIPTSATSKEKFDDLSLYIAKSWGVGKKVKNNGILIAISNGYSKIRIQNGLGIEKIISDETTKKVIDEKMISSFKESNYFEGLKNGVIELIRILDKEELSSKYDDSLISQLANKEITSLDSNNSVYWEIIKRSEKSIPSLIESLCDTTLTSIYDKCKGGYLTIGDVSYFALEEIAEFPAFLVTKIQFCTIDDGCWSFYDFMYLQENKLEFQKMVRDFYKSNDYKFKKFKKDEMNPARTKFKITGKLYLKS